MYNEQLKLSFIESEITSAYQRWRYEDLFSSSEKYEEQFGKDLCMMTGAELSSFINSYYSGSRSYSVSSRISVIRRYIKWCAEGGVDGAVDNTQDIENKAAENARKMTVASPSHLQRCLDAVFDAESDETIDNVYRAYLWLAYSGMEETDMEQLTRENIDLTYMEINLNGSVYPIYREEVPCLTNCMNLPYFRINHPNYAVPAKKERTDGDCILRGMKQGFNILQVRSAVSRKTRLAANEGRIIVKITRYRAWISGIFYRTREAEISGMEPDFLWVAKLTVNSDPDSRAYSESIARAAREYMGDYNNWKSAYNL